MVATITKDLSSKTIKIIIGMSIYREQKNTQRNLEYLTVVAKENSTCAVFIFDKTENLTFSPTSSNIFYQKIPIESLYETMCRVHLDIGQHIIWVNDDDEFHFEEFNSIMELGVSEVGFPQLCLKLGGDFELLNLEGLVLASSQNEGYRMYWELAAPLFFSVIPEFTFSNWQKYVRSSLVKFSHLDTQLSLSLSLSKSKKEIRSYIYRYNASNWLGENILESALNHLKQSKLAPEIMHYQNFLRKIEDISFLRYLERNTDQLFELGVYKQLLRQFQGFGGGKRNWVLVNLTPVRLRRKKILARLPVSSQVFFLGIPIAFCDSIVGAKPFKSLSDISEFLNMPNISNVLQIPQGQLDFWKENICSF